MISNVKLVVCDIDGTLTNDDKELSLKANQVIEKLHDRGILFGVASGRSIQMLKEYPKNWELKYPFDIIIGLNGAELWDNLNQKKSDYYMLSTEALKEIVLMLEPFDLNPMLYRDGVMFCKRIDEETISSSERNQQNIRIAEDLSEFWQDETAKIMFRMSEVKMEEVYDFVLKHPSKIFRGFKTQTTMLEFADARVNKSVALVDFCKTNDISLDNVMSFGDITNDNELLEVSGWGVCLLNGSDETKKIANDVTEFTNNEDGFANYIEKHLL